VPLFLPIIGIPLFPGNGIPVCAPLCRRNGKFVGAAIDPILVLGLVILWCVSEWNDEDDVLLVGDSGRVDWRLVWAGIPDVRRSAGVGIPERRRPVADSGRLNKLGVVRPFVSGVVRPFVSGVVRPFVSAGSS
jgi:hypothetical protein